MLEMVAAAGLVAGVVVALTRAAPVEVRRRPAPSRIPALVGHSTGDSWGTAPEPADHSMGHGADLPCPWCRAATSESDPRCPSCGQPFG